jgi:hypothetical protein
VSESAQPGTRDRAFAVAAVRALGARAELLCGRRSAALRRYAALLVREPALLDSEAARLDGAVPAGLREVHPSWYAEPPASSRPEAQAWLERRAYGHLVEMSVGGSSGLGTLVDRLEQGDPNTLTELLYALGRRRVATAFSGAPRAALAQLCARLGEPAASELLSQVRQVASQVSSDEVKAAQRALFHVGQPHETAAGTDAARLLFLRAGASWIGPALLARGGDRLRRVAQRLPRELGEALLAGAASPATEAESAAAVSVAAVMLASARPRSI